MELRHLRYFIAVAEHESVRVAAQSIHVTQPALSRQLQDLEEELGIALFDRTPRGLKLTAAGSVFLDGARRTLAAVHSAKRLAQQTAAGQEGHLRIGFIENAGWDGLVPDTFNRLQAEAPRLDIELVPLNTMVQVRELQAGSLDGGFINLFMTLPEGICARPVVQNNVMLAAPRNWDLPADAPLTAAMLSGRPMVGFPRAAHPAYYDRLLAACTAAGLTLNVVQDVSTETAIMSLVSAGIGCAIVNTANRGRPPALVRFLDIADLSVPMPLTFVYRKDNTNPALTRFCAALEATIASAACGSD